jgi:N-acetylmuramoyl-L-alanine amidase
MNLTRIFGFLLAGTLFGSTFATADRGDGPGIPVLRLHGDQAVWESLESTPATADWREELTAAASALIEPADRQGVFVSGASFDGLEIKDHLTRILVTVPAEADPLVRADLEDEVLQLLVQWSYHWPESGSILLEARREGEAGYRAIESFGSSVAIPPKPERETELSAFGTAEMAPMSVPASPAPGQAQPAGALSDTSIFLSPGHGWQFTSGDWRLQRPRLLEYNEDFGTAEAVMQYLHEYLWNAGARIYTTRERCFNTNMVIVTTGGPGYSQIGSWTTETASGAYGGTQRRATTVTGSPTGTATYTPDIPEAGFYGVYVWYRPATTGTTTQDARIHVTHTGDTTTWVQHQGRDGHTWKYIGRYYFEAGVNPGTGSVTITNESTIAGRQVVAGAVRFGGGMGDVPHGGPISGYPRWEEAGRYYAAFAGMPNWTAPTTAGVLSTWAAWEQESWEIGKSAYVSWHTNAGGGTGTETFAHPTPTAGSFELRNAIHHTVVRDIRAAWKSNWADRGPKAQNVSAELSPTNNPNMPAALIEVGFHDHVEDTKHLLDPEFRRHVSRAVYKGLVQYFVNHVPGFTNATYLPEPPRFFRLSDQGNGTATLTWVQPLASASDNMTGLYGHPATGYRVYRSSNGKGFDNGTDVTGTTFTVTDLEPGKPVYFRVTATNAGGESFPTATLAVQSAAAPDQRVLIVQGYDRLDRFQNVIEGSGATRIQRGDIRDLNTFNYAIQHAAAITGFGSDISVDSTTAQAVENGLVSLNRYRAVVWMAGLQAHVNDIGNRQFQALTPAMRNALQNYLQSGGRLFISGGELASDLNRAGAGNWLRDVLKVNYVQRSAGTNRMRGVSASIMADVSTTGFGEVSGAPYLVETPDAIAPWGGSAPLMRYVSPAVGDQVVDGFDSLGGWRQPSFSQQTNASSESSFAIVSSPVFNGPGAGRLDYVWGTGNFIRLHNANMPAFPADSDFSVWVRGDNSGHQVRVVLRDSDNELWVNEYLTLDFTGWRQFTWENVRQNPGAIWAVSPQDGIITGPNVRLDSFHVNRAGGGPASGSIFFDFAVASPVETGTNDLNFFAGTQFDGDYQVVYLATPFESIGDAQKRRAIMHRALAFFGFGATPFDRWLATYFTPQQREDKTISGPFVDLVGDGIPNLLKYAFGLDPWTPARNELPITSREGDKLRFGFRQAVEATDLDFIVEISDDLPSWRPAGDEVEVVSAQEEDGIRYVVVEDKQPISAGAKRFLRIRVEGL